MNVELLKMLLALGTGALSALVAFFSNYVPEGDHNSITFLIITVVVAAIKRGLDYLASKSATPTNPTATSYKG